MSPPFLDLNPNETVWVREGKTQHVAIFLGWNNDDLARIRWDSRAEEKLVPRYRIEKMNNDRSRRSRDTKSLPSTPPSSLTSPRPALLTPGEPQETSSILAARDPAVVEHSIPADPLSLKRNAADQISMSMSLEPKRTSPRRSSRRTVSSSDDVPDVVTIGAKVRKVRAQSLACSAVQVYHQLRSANIRFA